MGDAIWGAQVPDAIMFGAIVLFCIGVLISDRARKLRERLPPPPLIFQRYFTDGTRMFLYDAADLTAKPTDPTKPVTVGWVDENGDLTGVQDFENHLQALAAMTLREERLREVPDEAKVLGCESLRSRYWLPAFDSKPLAARADVPTTPEEIVRERIHPECEAVEAARIPHQSPAGKRMSEKTKVILGVILFPPFVWYVTRRGIDPETFIGVVIGGSVWVGAVIALAAGAFDNR